MTNTIQLYEWFDIVKKEYLEGFLKDGGSAIKFVVPTKEHLTKLLKDGCRSVASDLGYVVVEVDSSETKVHMPQEIFFRVAQQIDWTLLTRQMVLKLCKDAEYPDADVDLGAEKSVLEQISAATDIPRQIIEMRLQNVLPNVITFNGNMSRDFRVAMTHLCLMEMSTSHSYLGEHPLIAWLTGLNKKVSNVQRYRINNSIVRTNARHLLQSLLCWVRYVGYSGTLLLLDNSRVTLGRNPKDGLLFYSRPATMDHYELLREFIDDTDRLEGFFMVVLSSEEFLDDDNSRRGYGIYQALRWRVSDEVRSRNQANPLSTLVRLADAVG
jgi:hypothetical protein